MFALGPMAQTTLLYINNQQLIVCAPLMPNHVNFHKEQSQFKPK
jgi:hypothetical protein